MAKAKPREISKFAVCMVCGESRDEHQADEIKDGCKRDTKESRSWN